MSEHIESVKRIAEYLRELSDKYAHANHEGPASKLFGFSSELEKAAEHILDLEDKTSALPPDLGNIHDLPPELLSELSVAKTDELEDQIVTVINAYGGTASLDQILVGLFRKFKVVQKRRFIQNKLYRMAMVWSVDGRKGVYTTNEDVARNERDEVRHNEDMLASASGPDAKDVDDSEIPF